MSPIYVPGKVVLRKGWQPMDSDAAAYITAVETADTEPLEEKTKIAIDNFVLGCKEDGIWTAIKASCILAGARTLTGALVPLVGTAPTNPGGVFVSGDYDRKTGLVGDGSTKYLNSNRNNNADPQNSNHNAVFLAAAQSNLSGIIGAGGTSSGANNLGWSPTVGQRLFARNRSTTAQLNIASASPNSFLGSSRAENSAYSIRAASSNFTLTHASATPTSGSVLIFSRDVAAEFSNARLAFYSIGESLDLALLDARVTTLINAIDAAI